VIRFAYVTGWRSVSEVLPLKWEQVDYQAQTVRLEPGITKNKRGRVFPMTDELNQLLTEQFDAQETPCRRHRLSLGVPLQWPKVEELQKGLEDRL
jgi:integrase